MHYATHYDVGDRKRDGGINEDSVAVSVIEQGHRSGLTTDGIGEYGTGERDDEEDTPANRSAAVFALADGAGGHDAGDVASYLATTVICEELAPVVAEASRRDPDDFDVDIDESLLPDRRGATDLQTAVADAIVAAHRDVVRYAAESGTQAYTTVVAGLVVDGEVHYGWVGDSRAYLVNGVRESIELLTKDHGVVQELLDRGEVDDVAAHVHPRGNEITRALGGAGDGDPGNGVCPCRDKLRPTLRRGRPARDERRADRRPDRRARAVRTLRRGGPERRGRRGGARRGRHRRGDSRPGPRVGLAGRRRVGPDRPVERPRREGQPVGDFRSRPHAPADAGRGRGMPVRAIDPDDPVEDRETVIVPGSDKSRSRVPLRCIFPVH